MRIRVPYTGLGQGPVGADTGQGREAKRDLRGAKAGTAFPTFNLGRLIPGRTEKTLKELFRAKSRVSGDSLSPNECLLKIGRLAKRFGPEGPIRKV